MPNHTRTSVTTNLAQANQLEPYSIQSSNTNGDGLEPAPSLVPSVSALPPHTVTDHLIHQQSDNPTESTNQDTPTVPLPSDAEMSTSQELGGVRTRDRFGRYEPGDKDVDGEEIKIRSEEQRLRDQMYSKVSKLKSKAVENMVKIDQLM